MDACDSFIPEPVREIDKPFLMPIEDVFTISGRGTVVTGRVERGIIKAGEPVEIIGMVRDTQKTVATSLEMFRKILDDAEAGDNVGVLLRGIDKTDVQRGQVLAKPGTVTPHTKFKSELRSSQGTSPSSTSGLPTLQATSSSLKAWKWSCQAITLRSRLSLSCPSLWRKASASQSVKADTPSVLAL